MRGEAVAAEQHVDITVTDQTGDQVAGAGVHQHRAADEDDSAASFADLSYSLGDLADKQRLRLLARDATAHEREDLRLRARPLERRDPHAFVADDDLLASLSVW